MTRAEFVLLLLEGDPDAIDARIEAREERLFDREWARKYGPFVPPHRTIYRLNGLVK